LDSTGVVIGFWVLSGITVVSALLVLLARNLLHSLSFLVLTFLGMAGLFITLSADFIAVAQILIYAGSISVLMVFAVMLTPLASRDNGNSIYLLPALAGGLGLAAIVGFVAVDTDWNERSGAALGATDFPGTVNVIGDLLLGRYVLAFEVASVLLLFALLGAILLVQDRDADGVTAVDGSEG
jgi:NADH:ubiquinone oxidoreductase subunit 6 (subunit J)